MLTDKIVPRGKFASALFAFEWLCVTRLVRWGHQIWKYVYVNFLLEKIYLLGGNWCWISCRRIHKSELRRCLVRQLQRTLASLCSESPPLNRQTFLDCRNLLKKFIYNAKLNKKCPTFWLLGQEILVAEVLWRSAAFGCFLLIFANKNLQTNKKFKCILITFSFSSARLKALISAAEWFTISCSFSDIVFQNWTASSFCSAPIVATIETAFSTCEY